MNIYVFGNGNLSFEDFKLHYEAIINRFLHDESTAFSICDFRGVDTLTMELLKCRTKNVMVYHVSEKPRYLPDKHRTMVAQWKVIGGFENDEQRDLEAIQACTHFIAVDFNSDNNRKSGTLRNIEKCEEWGKIRLENE